MNKDELDKDESSKPEGEIKSKRGRGRPRKEVPKPIEKSNTEDEKCITMNNDENVKASVFSCAINDEFETNESHVKDEVYHALLSNINTDPINYKEAMESEDKKLWQKAINDELNSMEKNNNKFGNLWKDQLR